MLEIVQQQVIFSSEVHATEEIYKVLNYIVDAVVLGAFISVN